MSEESRPSLRDLYFRYGCCMAYISVESERGEGIGSAFHVGDGIFVTARHVTDTFVKEMRLTNPRLFYRSDLYPKNADGSYTITPSSPEMCLNQDGLLTVIGGPWYSDDNEVDIAALRVEGMAPGAHFVPLGDHLDDWVGHGDFELSEVLALGYPPIPFTGSPLLVAARCQVNATANLHIGSQSQLHFILSGIPRGGFSGGLALSEWGFALGVITQSLLTTTGPPELGYFAVASVSVVYECLAQNGVLPEAQRVGWDGLWDY